MTCICFLKLNGEVHILEIIFRPFCSCFLSLHLVLWDFSCRFISPDKITMFISCHKKSNSATGTRSRVAWVRAEYPNQLDYSGDVICAHLPCIWELPSCAGTIVDSTQQVTRPSFACAFMLQHSILQFPRPCHVFLCLMGPQHGLPQRLASDRVAGSSNLSGSMR